MGFTLDFQLPSLIVAKMKGFLQNLLLNMYQKSWNGQITQDMGKPFRGWLFRFHQNSSYEMLNAMSQQIILKKRHENKGS